MTKQQRYRRLVRAFRASGLSKKEIGRRARCTDVYVGMLLAGHLPTYKQVTLERVERVLGILDGGR